MAIIKVDNRFLANPIPGTIDVKQEEGFQIIEIKDRLSVADLIEEEILVLTQPVVAVINGTTADLDQILEIGDEVRLLPQIAGGKS
jgi:molybdopterin converting factor small subunit